MTTTYSATDLQGLLDGLSHGQIGANTLVTVQLADSTARCHVVRGSAMACALDELVVTPTRSTLFSANQLREFAKTLSSRMTYLLEPIAVHEHDAESASVKLRSFPPSRASDETVRYYELYATTNSLSLLRFEKRPGVERRSIDMTMTLEVLSRLLVDLNNAFLH